MNISIVSINYAPELTGISVYTTGLAEYLAQAGHRVVVHTGFPYYPAWSKRPEDWGKLYRTERIAGVDVRRCYVYVPRNPSAVRRMIHELSFTVSSALFYSVAPRADVTVVVSPPLALGLPVALLARLRGSKTVLHVQDLQPDAAVELGMLRPGSLTRLLYAIERATYSCVDRVSSISSAMLRRIESKGVKPRKTLLFRNWADRESAHSSTATATFREEWGLVGRFVLLYSGNMGVKQGLGSLLDLAKVMEADSEVVIVIVGDGGEKARLMERARLECANNVIFKNLVAREDLGRLLASADVALIPQKKGVADIVLPSKLGNLLNCGCPVIAATPVQSELGQIIEQQRCGLVVPPEDHAAMAQAVRSLKSDPAQRLAMANNGIAFARQKLSASAILEGFLDELTALGRGKNLGEPERKGGERRGTERIGPAPAATVAKRIQKEPPIPPLPQKD